MINKLQLRRTFKKIRDDLPLRKEKSEIICSSFLESDIYKSCTSLLLYSPIGSEVDTSLILNKALLDGKRVAYPLCLDKCGSMEFYYIQSEADLHEGTFGIKEPCADCDKAVHDSLTVCLVPGLSFDLFGARLGYGKGYYDRFLNSFCGISVGLSYDECIFDSLPFGEHDKKVNYLITDKSIYNFYIKEE